MLRIKTQKASRMSGTWRDVSLFPIRLGVYGSSLSGVWAKPQPQKHFGEFLVAKVLLIAEFSPLLCRKEVLSVVAGTK